MYTIQLNRDPPAVLKTGGTIFAEGGGQFFFTFGFNINAETLQGCDTAQGFT